MIPDFFRNGTQQLTLLLRAAGLKGRQIKEAVQVTTESVVQDLKIELNKGNYQEVISFLKTNSTVLGKTLILERLTSKLVSRLMLRLGLPGMLAAGVVTILLPFVLARLRKKAMEKKDAEEFLDTFEIVGDEQLQGQVQKALDQGTAVPASKGSEETPAKEGAPKEGTPDEPAK